MTPDECTINQGGLEMDWIWEILRYVPLGAAPA